MQNNMGLAVQAATMLTHSGTYGLSELHLAVLAREGNVMVYKIGYCIEFESWFLAFVLILFVPFP